MPPASAALTCSMKLTAFLLQLCLRAGLARLASVCQATAPGNVGLLLQQRTWGTPWTCARTAKAHLVHPRLAAWRPRWTSSAPDSSRLQSWS